jgi:hypothetical protein
MAFSGSADFSYTRDQIIYAALRKCRAYDADGGAPEAYQTANAAEALNRILKALQLEGTLLWVIQKIEVPQTASQASYAIGQSVSADVDTVPPVRVISALLHNTDTDTDLPLELLSREGWDAVADKLTEGTPSQVYYDQQIPDGILYSWPVPEDATYEFHLTVETELQDFDASGTTAYMPSYAYNYFVYALAADQAMDYGLDLQSLAYLESKAEALKEKLMDYQTSNVPLRIRPGVEF